MSSKTFTLRRRYFEHGTFGELVDNSGNRLAVTVECPWLNNQPGKSCIPEGAYTLAPHNSPSKGLCLAISGPSLGVTVNGPSLRTHCLIHVANKASELEGCIAPGERFGVVSNEWAVLNSRNTLDKVLAAVGLEATLVVRGQ